MPLPKLVESSSSIHGREGYARFHPSIVPQAWTAEGPYPDTHGSQDEWFYHRNPSYPGAHVTTCHGTCVGRRGHATIDGTGCRYYADGFAGCDGRDPVERQFVSHVYHSYFG